MRARFLLFCAFLISVSFGYAQQIAWNQPWTWNDNTATPGGTGTGSTVLSVVKYSNATHYNEVWYYYWTSKTDLAPPDFNGLTPAWKRDQNENGTIGASLAPSKTSDPVATYGRVWFLFREIVVQKSGYVRTSDTNSGWREVVVTISQTLTASLFAGTVEAGQSVSGQASGLLGGNTYSFSVLSGGVSVVGDQNTGAFTVTANANYTGAFQIQISGSAGGGYSAPSPVTVSGSVTEGQSYKVTVNFDNRNSSIAREFKVYQDGQVVATRVIPGGALVSQSITVPSSSPVSVTAVVGGSLDGPIWISDGVSEIEVGTGTPTQVKNSQPPTNSTTATNNPTPNTNTKPDDKKVWQTINNNNKTSFLASNTYAEGVDSTNSILKEIKTEVVKINERNASLDEISQSINDDLDTVRSNNAVGSTSNYAEFTSGLLNKTQVVVPSGMPQPSSPGVSGIIPSDLQVNGGVLGTISIDPLKSGLVSPTTRSNLLAACSWLKALISAFIVYGVFALIWEKMIEALHRVASTPAATEGIIIAAIRTQSFGGFNAALTAIPIKGVLIVVSIAFLIGLPILVVALLSNQLLGFTWSSIFGDLSGAITGSSGSGGMVGRVWEWVNLIYPVAVWLTARAYYHAQSTILSVGTFGIQVAVRYLNSM